MTHADAGAYARSYVWTDAVLRALRRSLEAEWKDRTRIQSRGLGIGLERFRCAAESILSVRRTHDSGPNSGIELESEL